MAKIIRMNRESKSFYPLMGPFLSRRSVVKELGFPVWDDDGKTWFVATERRKVIGFCGLLQHDGKAQLVSAYVLPEHRGKGIYRYLFEARLAAIKRPCRARSVVTAGALPMFREHGFKRVGKRGRYTVMEKMIDGT